MSRVACAMMNPGGETEMARAVPEALDALALEVSTTAGIVAAETVEMVFVCNPVMHHLLLGLDPVDPGHARAAIRG
jgi:uncharacterized 2Fe-2S/4Fe-4S cluster protein (DUF4445 family)